MEQDLSRELELDTLNKFALERVNQYQSLEIGNFEISTPFYSNDVGNLFAQMMEESGVSGDEILRIFSVYNDCGIPYGWYRGKGRPEQIIFGTREIAKIYGLDLSRAASPEVIVEFMKSVGLGIDCSGFVYQTMKYAFDKAGYNDVLNEVLEWPDFEGERNEYKVGITNFVGPASKVIDPDVVRPMDFIVTKDLSRRGHSHIALVLENSDSLAIAQSVIGQIPTGVHVSPLVIRNGTPLFGFRPNLTESWEYLNKTKRLEFRRLKVFERWG